MSPCKLAKNADFGRPPLPHGLERGWIGRTSCSNKLPYGVCALNQGQLIGCVMSVLFHLTILRLHSGEQAAQALLDAPTTLTPHAGMNAEE